MEIREPNSENEWQRYYDLRWRVLREMCQQPVGSEKDDLEDDSYHLMAIEGDRCIGVGRVHFNHASQGQIRYMAVEPDWRKQGIGRRILELLEVYLLRNSAESIVLNARVEAVEFYQKHGYEVIGDGPLLFDQIAHKRMQKRLM